MCTWTWPDKLKWTCKSFALICYIISLEINKWHFAKFQIIKRIRENNARDTHANAVIWALDSVLKIVFFVKKQKIAALTYRMFKMYATTGSKSVMNYIYCLILSLILNDICSILTMFAFYLTLKRSFFEVRALQFSVWLH